MVDDYDFSATLRRIRMRNCLNQKQLEEKCGFTPNLISNWEIRHSKPPLMKLRAMCIALGCSANEMLGLPEPGLTDAETDLLHKLRRLDADGHDAVLSVLESQLRRLND